MELQSYISTNQKVAVEEYPNRVLELVPEPLVSCRISTYNHAPYIAHCIESMLMQETDFPFEIVIGEDESSDGTRDICIAYAKKHPDKIRLFLHSRENNIAINGRPSGRFQALYSMAQSRGKYIAPCEADDYWTDPFKLQKQVTLMEAHPEASLCVAKTEMIQDGKVLAVLGEATKRLFGFHDVMMGLYFHLSTFLHKSTDFREIFQSYSALLSDDTSMRILFADRGKLVHIDEVVSVYRVTGEGVWSGRDAEDKHKHNYGVYKRFFLHFKWKRKLYFLAHMVNIIRLDLKRQIKLRNWGRVLQYFLQMAFYGVVSLILLPIHILLNLFTRRTP